MSIYSGKTEPVKVKFNNDAKTIHDIDLFAHGPTNYEYKDIVPVSCNGETLAGMFPRGAQPKIPSGKAGMVFIRKWYWIWSQYDRLINSLTSHFEYKGLPDEIKPHHIENILNKEGSGAFVKLNDKYVIVNYDTKKTNIYGEATNITISLPNKHYDKKNFKADNFVIMCNNTQKSSTFNDTIQYLEGQYSALEALRRNNVTSQPKGIFLQKSFTDENGTMKPIEMSLNAVAEGTNTFYTLSFADSELKYQKSMTMDNGIKDFFIPIEFTDRTDNLIKEVQFWKNEIYEQIGLKVNLSMDKKEKLITSEIQSNSSNSDDILDNKLKVRQSACDEINKKFGLNISVELKTDELEQEIQEKEQNGDTNYQTKKKWGKRNE